MSEWDAQRYHRVSNPQLEWGRRVLRRLAPQAGERILDIGCGTGRLTAELVALLGEGTVVGIDRSEAMLREAAAQALEEGQRAEERVGSVDYDVCACPGCAYRFTLRYPKWATAYAKCPQCLNHTKSSTETVVERERVHGEGSARVVEQCAFCNYHVEYTKVLPRIERSASSGGSSGRSSGSSSSFGGGRSGGGGASRGY